MERGGTERMANIKMTGFPKTSSRPATLKSMSASPPVVLLLHVCFCRVQAGARVWFVSTSVR